MNNDDIDILLAKYNLAVEEGKDSFYYNGQEVLTQYAYYLLASLGRTPAKGK